jgi:putative ABC transport system ATP-binding protein
VVEAEGVHFAYPNEAPVLHDATLHVGREVVALTGASGSGKSTLLLCLAGILVPQGGRVTLDGQEISALDDDDRCRVRRERLGLVFQSSELVAELTLAENVALPLELLGEGRRAAWNAAVDLLDELGIAELAQRRPAQVSGGQAQRAAMGRALVHRPAVVLADEPTGALDTRNADVVLGLMLQAARRRGSAVIVVTHDPAVAAAADRVAPMPSLTAAGQHDSPTVAASS